MQLYHAPTSPYARKVMACAIARGIESQITLVPAGGETPGIVAVNPLGKVPCLVTEDGTALFDSRVICEFLDGVGEVLPLFSIGRHRMRALRFQALADGICDAAVLSVGEKKRPSEPARDTVLATQRQKILRSLAVLEADLPASHLDIGAIAVACALGYLDLRFPDEAWRNGRPGLAAWNDAILQHACLAQTVPA